MFNINPFYYQITNYVFDNFSYYALPIVSLSCGYIFRKQILKTLNYIAKKYLPLIFNRSIKINDNNSQIHQILDKEFQSCIAKIEKEKSYTKKGRQDYQFPAQFYGLTKAGQAVSKISALDIISKRIKIHTSSESLKILDLGTGNGSFIYNLSTLYSIQIEAHGLSALDTRDYSILSLDHHPNVKYFVGNVERLFQLTPIQKNYYDIIFSSFCFMHLTDPIIALINAYDALKENGEMYIDHFLIKGLNVKNLKQTLSQKEYKFNLLGSGENVDYIHIIKNIPSLDLPINYKMPLEKTSDRQFMQYAWIN